MSAPMIWIGLAVFSFAFFWWIIRQDRFGTERISCSDGAITKVLGGKATSINTADISEVRYSYHSVVGFVFAWELIDQKGETFKISGGAEGIDDVLPFLESTLPGFSAKDFEEQFKEGDMEDAIEVWKRS